MLWQKRFPSTAALSRHTQLCPLISLLPCNFLLLFLLLPLCIHHSASGTHMKTEQMGTLSLHYFSHWHKIKNQFDRIALVGCRRTNKTIQMSHSVRNRKAARRREGSRKLEEWQPIKGGSERGRKTGRYAKGFSMFNFQIGLSRMTFSWRLQAQHCLSWYWYAGGALLVTGTNTVDEWEAFPQQGVKCKFEMREKQR